MLERALLKVFEKKVRPQKVLILLGARRVGKTQLVNAYLSKQNQAQCLHLNGDDLDDAAKLKDRTVANYKRMLTNIKLLVIDEAQYIPDVGLALKLMVDHIPDLKIIATGSSSFDMAGNVGEPLVGRKNTLILYPLAQMELARYENFKQTQDKLEERLIFGGYPELEQYPDWKDKQDYLHEIINAYLLKDILVFEGLRQADKILSLLKLLAFQVGSQVSVDELGKALGISKNTAERYLDLLCKVFVIYKLPGYSRNLRKEVTKTSKWFFVDNGIRNAVIHNFSRLSERNDVGSLWENFVAIERKKYMAYQERNASHFFWRTYDQQEIDLVEEENNHLRAFEAKFDPNKRVKVPGAWAKSYQEAEFNVVNRQNFLDWVV